MSALSLWDALTPFRNEFMANALAMGLLVGLPTALLSCFLVLKGWSLMGDAISHAVLPGIVLAYIVQVPLVLGALAAAMACSLLTGFLAENSRVKPDTAMGIVFSGMFGLGVVMFAKVQSEVHLDHILFGNMLGVDRQDLVHAALIALPVAAVLCWKHRDLILFSFDPVQARAVGLRTGWLHYGLLAMVSMTVVATLKAAGIILAIGLLIIPGAIAFLLTRSLPLMLLAAVGLNWLAAFAGLIGSFHLDSAPAPTIILCLSFLFVVAFLFRAFAGSTGERRTSS